MERNFRQELADFGWEFHEEGAELVDALEEAIEDCDFSPARRVMEDWLETL